MDEGHIKTDKILSDLEKGLKEVYGESYKTVRNKLDEVKELIEELNKESDPIKRLVLSRRKDRLTTLMDHIARDIKGVNVTATKMINNEMLNVYEENINWGHYFLEQESGYILNYDLYNKNIIKKLYAENVNPFTKIALNNIKDKSRIYRDLRRHFSSAIRSGETIEEIAKRVRGVVDRNHYGSVRIARTETTRLESIGRQESFKQGEELGLILKKVWISTSDPRTRTSHLMLNGKTIDMDKTFSNGLLYPGEYGGDAHEVINCRCTHIAEIKGSKKNSNFQEMEEEFKGETFEKWKDRRGEAVKSVPTAKDLINKARSNGVSKDDIGKLEKRKRKSDFSTREEYSKYLEGWKEKRAKQKIYIEDKLEKMKNAPRRYTNQKEAETKILELGAKTVNLDGIDPKFFDELIDALEINKAKFPQFLEELNYVGGNNKLNETYLNTILRDNNITDYMKENKVSKEVAEKWINENMIIDDVWGDASMEGSYGITMNSKHFADYEYVVNPELDGFLDGFRVEGTGNMVSSFTHELGHVLDRTLRDQYNVKVGNAGGIVDKILDKFPNSNISQYSLTNTGEYFAELYTDMMLSATPSKEAKFLEELLKEALN